MREKEVTIEKSSEILRLALPLMSRYRVPVTPQNYAVWYEHVAGTNLPLKEAIDALTAADESIDEEVTADLYRKFVDPTDMSRFDEAQQALRSLAESVTSSLVSVNGEVSKYEESLKECSSQLAGNMNPEEFKTLVCNLEASTHRMSAGSHDLQRHLEESRREAEALREELAKARAEAKTDAMTGLANRKGFDEAIGKLRAAAERSLSDACLLICDIDKFKSINDTYGHLFGDKVIKAVADVLSKQTKGKDLASRFGGEEFVVLLPETDVEGAVAVAESIRSTIENSRVVRPKTGEEVRRLTISIGVTRFVEGEQVKETISRADEALYAAKENGRNRVEVNPAPDTIKIVNQ
jgi:diguanylate cyclase